MPIESMPGRRRLYLGERVSIVKGGDFGTLEHGTVVILLDNERGDRNRPHHLVWNGTEWVDDRCGCRYHPDDDNGSHGGAPHIHRCERHKASK